MKKFVIAAAVVALSATSALAGSGGWTATTTTDGKTPQGAWTLDPSLTTTDVQHKPTKMYDQVTGKLVGMYKTTVTTETYTNPGDQDKTVTSTTTYSKTVGKQ